jgi:hypothetical protein
VFGHRQEIGDGPVYSSHFGYKQKFLKKKTLHPKLHAFPQISRTLTYIGSRLFPSCNACGHRANLAPLPNTEHQKPPPRNVRSFVHSFILWFCLMRLSRIPSSAVSRCPTKFLCVDAGIATAVVLQIPILCKIPEIYLSPRASSSWMTDDSSLFVGFFWGWCFWGVDFLWFLFLVLFRGSWSGKDSRLCTALLSPCT